MAVVRRTVAATIAIVVVQAPAVVPGEQWQLRIKLRSVRGFQNPGGFDYEAWSLASRHRRRRSVPVRQTSHGGTGLELGSAAACASRTLRCASLRARGIVLALLTGDGGLMSDDDWSLFRATGTVHLMVISGLHLTIVATLGVALGDVIARLSPGLLARGGTGWFGTCAAPCW